MAVQTFSSAKVQANFGEAADIAKSGEPVAITQYGRPTLMLMSYKDGEEMLRLRSTARIHEYMNERLKNMPVDVPELSMDDINNLVHELRP
jgi:prevent-host-death family protein